MWPSLVALTAFVCVVTALAMAASRYWLGIMPPPQALAIARQKGLDLVEISPTAVPPVCRIMDFGKYQYQEQKRAAEERERAGAGHGGGEKTSHGGSRFLRGQRIDPRRLDGSETVVQLIEQTFLAYNAARLREACQLYTQKMLAPDVTVGLTLTGALTPAGLGLAALIPLIEAGFGDWIISTGANLYHDTHFGLGLAMHRGNPQESDTVLREEGIVRIYDIFFDYDVLLSTDAFFRKIIQGPEFQRSMSSAE